MVGFWATLSLNIPDFTRYAKSQKAQIRGQAIGLPPSMTLFAFIGVVVTSATTIIYGTTIWDPVALAGRFENKIMVSFAMIAVAISTLATNIAANIVSPANDFSNLAPTKINFRTGGYITGIIGILIFPWKLMADPSGYIFTWLIGYSSFAGTCWRHHDRRLLFYPEAATFELLICISHERAYTVIPAVLTTCDHCLLLGILPNIPGFLLQVKPVRPTIPFRHGSLHLYNYAWFVGFFVSGTVYISTDVRPPPVRTK